MRKSKNNCQEQPFWSLPETIHHILDKDTTLNRMGGNLIFAVFGLLALAIALSFPAREFIGELFSKGAVQEVPLQDSSDTSE